MSTLSEGGDQRGGGPASSPFAKTELLRVGHGNCLSCSTDVKADAPSDELSLVETEFGPSGRFEWTVLCGKCRLCCVSETFESVSRFSKRADWSPGALSISVAACVRKLCERCFYGCESLGCVRFSAASKLERICGWAFGRTSIESLSIPDSVVELDEKCFYKCKSLRYVAFGISSKLERICGWAFCGTSIESLSIPDNVVEIGKRCFHKCESFRLVTFGAASKLERICGGAFCGTSIESLSIPDSVVDLS